MHSSPVTGPLDAVKVALTMGVKVPGEGPGLNRKGTCRYTGPRLELYGSNNRKARVSFARTSI